MSEYSYELYHHGVKGMKWGVRRYQYKDGSLTPAGRRREAKNQARQFKSDAKAEIKKLKQDAAVTRRSAKSIDRTQRKLEKARKKYRETSSDKQTRSHKKMSEAELKSKIERMKLETEYKNLKQRSRTEGQEFAVKVLKNIGENTLTNLGTQAANHFVGEAINRALKVSSDDVAKRIVNPQKGQSDKK